MNEQQAPQQGAQTMAAGTALPVEEQVKLRAAIESMNLGFLYIDVAEKISVRNKVFGDIFAGKEFDDLAGFAQILPTANLPAQFRRVASSMQSIDIAEAMWGEKVLHIYLAPVSTWQEEHQTYLGGIILVEDITEAKMTERSRDEFLSIASHELRTPLTVIQGNTSLLQDLYGDQLKDENIVRIIADIHESSQHLIKIVNDFLDVSSIEEGNVLSRPEEFDVSQVVERVIHEMQPAINAKKIYLTSEVPAQGVLPKLWADADRTKQIIYNLVDNAAKFTDQGGVTISTKVEQEMLRIVVSDTGKGIPESSQKLLFHKFQQVSDSLLTRDNSGTGLGLYICRILAQQMGGDIKLDSAIEGKGSVFSFSLPIASSATRQAAPVVKPDVQAQIPTTTEAS